MHKAQLVSQGDQNEAKVQVQPNKTTQQPVENESGGAAAAASTATSSAEPSKPAAPLEKRVEK